MDSTQLFNDMFNPFKGGIDLPVTNDEERKLVAIVHDVTCEEIRKMFHYGDHDDAENPIDEFSVKLEDLKENMKRILRAFEETAKARKEFLGNFQNWRCLRETSVNQLSEITRDIQNYRTNSNAGKAVAVVAGVGGVAAVVGALIFPPAAPVALAAAAPAFAAAVATPVVVTPLLVGGGIAVGASVAIGTGVSLAETIVGNIRVKKALEVLHADGVGFMYLETWFKHAQEIIKAIQSIIDFDAMQSWFDDLMTSLSWFKDFQKMGNEKFELFKCVVKFCVNRMLGRSRMFLLEFGIQLSKTIITFLFTTVWLNRSNRFLFECVGKTLRLTVSYRSVFVTSELTEDMSDVLANVALVQLSLTRRDTLGTFAGIGLAINAATVFLTTGDLTKESQSKKGEKSGADKKLAKEYDVMEEVHTFLSSL